MITDYTTVTTSGDCTKATHGCIALIFTIYKYINSLVVGLYIGLCFDSWLR